MSNGICTLANDRVYDQLVALLNSIEANGGKDLPVCVYPYDDQTEEIAKLIAQRPQVELYRERESMERWDNFAKAAWDSHPTARIRWQQAGSNGYHRFGTHRRYCAFDGPFDRFVYMDADTLLLSPIDYFWEKLDDYDCVVYDYQYKDPSHVYEVSSPKLLKIFSEERIKKEIFCSGIYASKKNLFEEEKRNWILEQLRSGESEIIYPMAVDQPLLNYMMMRTGTFIYNYALNTPPEKRVGNCVTDPKFVEKDNLLYDKGYRLIYLHYIGISSSFFTRCCQGENIDFPYRSLFLYYRYLYEPESYPQFKSSPVWYNQPKSLGKRMKEKLQRIARKVFSN
ncbi:MAG: sugar transferase [Microcystis panniformis Mp_MB_F_20051200_S9]|uniref:Sugar transferase n=1 Tax=Microcystis panniformis Mp_MB_F_20051200_S9 TaxID=2486223 RepID=A0A552Q8W5_9CHRO|nr:MAG: sugar transferase [Microcystis panniformis Mp_MB_F_20080800_S26D]TRV46943.1 MAG: sugar transferase [Microcystis panniformis Mp_GB_SS_20050300_S99]TRV55883.1 MAG: sugar transferase [Microcystis panniformis Mp_GB_SS_20050300_S99D]TRV57006.1 MAG: sugar transferase [Microcystis panniformis Mp_MB_F_20080800_S26]TRV57349.1 MAG: sugar transferase [Microcystis panniformis Mp_MB_F_20051200_S9D]TRV65664.1 MAG: sugar transferase [Microcystis panniformis Mp_MB_F_20051200_S9]TRV70627.1 MAG: sugar 